MPDCVQLKTEWADKHIQELDRAVAEFLGTNPYTVARKRDPNTGDHFFYLDSADSIRPELALMAGDAIYNLYSSLDYLAWELADPEDGALRPLFQFPSTRQPQRAT